MKNPINFGAQNNNKSVYTTGVNNHFKNNYHVGNGIASFYNICLNTILKSANEFVKYFIPFCKISVGLLVSPLFIFILHSAIAF